MFDFQGKYRASVFVTTAEIVPSPDIISTLLNMFRDKGLLPTTFQEVGHQGPAPLVRLRLNSPNNEWGINFASRRIDVEKNPVLEAGRNMGAVPDFATEVKEIFSRILGHFNKRGHRLSITTFGMLREMTTEQLSDIYTRLFHPLPFYEQSMPFEWKSKCASRSEILIGAVLEPINVITSMNRVRGHFSSPSGVTSFDRIEVGFDINTIAENEDNRFTAESLNGFLDNALIVRSTIIEQIRGILNARSL